MAEFKVAEKEKNAGTAVFYFALKSQDEIYYQMASIFKAITKDKDKLAEKIFMKGLIGNQSEIFLENYM